jgi:hypothetical protein
MSFETNARDAIMAAEIARHNGDYTTASKIMEAEFTKQEQAWKTIIVMSIIGIILVIGIFVYKTL